MKFKKNMFNIARKNYYKRAINDVQEKLEEDSKNLQKVDKELVSVRRRKKRLHRKYCMSFDLFYQNKLWPSLGVKEFEDLRMKLIEKIKTENDNIIFLEKRIDYLCDCIENLLGQLCNLNKELNKII